jgi:hypothetical protein
MPKGFTEAPSGSGRDMAGDVLPLDFCMQASSLFRHQQQLRLCPEHLSVLLQLAEFWWEADCKPFHSRADLAARLHLSEGQVRRHLYELEERGFLRRCDRGFSDAAAQYDLSGLMMKLQDLDFEATFNASQSPTRAGCEKADTGFPR